MKCDTRIRASLIRSITADHPRPFVIAKGSELDVALPEPKHRRRRKVWKAAEPIGQLALPAPPTSIDLPVVIDHPVEDTINDDGVRPARTLSFAQSIAMQTGFGLDQLLINPAPNTRHKVFRFEAFCHQFIVPLIKRMGGKLGDEAGYDL